MQNILLPSLKRQPRYRRHLFVVFLYIVRSLRCKGLLCRQMQLRRIFNGGTVLFSAHEDTGVHDGAMISHA